VAENWPKHFNPSDEVELLRLWESEGLFETKLTGRPVFVIDTPPPYPSGRPHIGGTASYAQIDMVARFLRMRGFDVVFPFYLDRNGLPIEVQVERKYNINAHEVPREKFLELCRRELDELEKEFISIFRRWGMSFDYWREGTDSERYRAMTQATFIEMWRRGLIYEAERPTLWCPRCRTALAEAELEYREEEGVLYYIKFRVKETGEEIVIATTRPELLPATVAVIFNPEDERYKHLEGKHALVPPDWHEVPILPHPAAKKEFGTGLVMISTFGDTRDIMIAADLSLPIKVVLDEEGRLREGVAKGLYVRDARKVTVERLREMGLVVREERLRHEVPVCWRCKTPVEIIVTRELFAKQLEIREELLRLAEQMDIKPPEYRQVLIDWIKSLRFDWPISRRRYYATEIPIWWCREGDSLRPVLPSPGKYYRPWRDEPPPEVKEQCRGELIGDTRVLDTWFDSSISWMYASTIRYERMDVMESAWPHNVLRPQGYDIIRTWLYYSLLRAYQLRRNIPFRYVRINGMGLDERGEAMHKSKGNIIDPIPPVEKYGADAVRFWAAAASRLGSDYRYSESMIREGREFVVKVWNLARFVYRFPDPGDDYELTALDMAILARLRQVAERVIKAYEGFDVYEPAHELYNFLWREFADHYVEGVKPRAYNRGGEFPQSQMRGAWKTLRTVMDYSLKLLAPIMPFVTDKIWRIVYGRTIHRETIEDPPQWWGRGSVELLDAFKAVNSFVWRWKNSRGMSLAEPLNATLIIPRVLEPAASDVKAMHRAARVVIGDKIDIVED